MASRLDDAIVAERQQHLIPHLTAKLPKGLDDKHIWLCVIVRPKGKFSPMSKDDRPRRYEIDAGKWLSTGGSRDWIEEKVHAYNSHALSLGWKSWAMLMVDKIELAFTEAAKKVESDFFKIRVDRQLSKPGCMLVSGYLDTGHNFDFDGKPQDVLPYVVATLQHQLGEIIDRYGIDTSLGRERLERWLAERKKADRRRKLASKRKGGAK